ncbi:MAG: hypothetical protein BWX84_03115 [Verrucomicrobia bacterium ADurb.Bin118]|nr:MAG: hypothetical protein BWX84_03115 [Verrucomicrobia bacterium ADurb.Bin118]
MAQPAFDMFQFEFRVLENGRVRLELDVRPVRLARFTGVLLLELAHFELRLGKFTVAMAAHDEVFRQRIHRLRADAVEADAELEHVVVVFGARVDAGNTIHHLAQRDAAPVIAHADVRAVNRDFDLLAVAHDVFVNGVINDLLEQDVTTVVVMVAVADASDVHAGAQPDVLQRTQCLDLALVVIVFWFGRHRNSQ